MERMLARNLIHQTGKALWGPGGCSLRLGVFARKRISLAVKHLPPLAYLKGGSCCATFDGAKGDHGLTLLGDDVVNDVAFDVG
jgi:hypothetical protein